MNDYTGIADLYDSYVTDGRDLAFWSRWAGRSSGPILELTAGTGRATVSLVAATSQPVIALDLSPAMLTRLVERFRGAPRAALAVAANATALPFPAVHFGLVVFPFNSFGELTERADRRRCLHEIGRILGPDGTAILTLHDPIRRRQSLDGVPQLLGPMPCASGRLEVHVCGRPVDGDVAESEQTYRLFDDRGELTEERRATLRFALPDAEWLVAAVRDAGLDLVSLFGDYEEAPYVPGVGPFIIAVLRQTR